jgi:hypothetical protein
VVAEGGLPREETVECTPGGSGDTTYGDAKFKKNVAIPAPPGRASLGGSSGWHGPNGGGHGSGAGGVGWGVDIAPDAQQPQTLDPEMTPHNVRRPMCPMCPMCPMSMSMSMSMSMFHVHVPCPCSMSMFHVHVHVHVHVDLTA